MTRKLFGLLASILFLLNNDFQSVVVLGSLESICQVTPWHRLLLANALIWLGKLNEASDQQDCLSENFMPPERIELRARIALLRGEYQSSLTLLSFIGRG